MQFWGCHGWYLCLVLYTLPGILGGSTGLKYRMLYGGVVGQEVEVTLDDIDVRKAIEVALQTSELVNSAHHIIGDSISKQRLLYSTNDIEPYVYNHTASAGARLVSVQKRQIVLGIFYGFSIIENCTDESQLLHKFVLTRDKTKDYHVYRHTVNSPQSTPPISSNQVNSNFPMCTLNNKDVGSHESHTEDRVFVDEASVTSPLWSPISNGRLTQRYSGNLFTKKQLTEILRVATYNIWNVNGIGNIESYEDRLQRLRKLLKSQSFDIYGFQEVRLQVSPHNGKKKSTHKVQRTQSQVSQLASILSDYQFVYQPAMIYMDNGHNRNEEGLAIFSKYPIVSSDYILLYRNVTDDVDVHQRICLHAEILTPLATVHVFVTHLSLNPTSQERSVVEIWKHMHKYTGLKILMGDFNAEDGTNVIRFLSDNGTLGGLRAMGWKDLWLADSSNVNLTGNTFSALEIEPVKRIDFLFMRQPDPPILKVLSTDIFGYDNDCFVPCSDHYGIVTKLKHDNDL